MGDTTWVDRWMGGGVLLSFVNELCVFFGWSPHLTYISRKSFQIRVDHTPWGRVSHPPPTATPLDQIELSVQGSFSMNSADFLASCLIYLYFQ